MRQLKRTWEGLRTMPERARLHLGRGLLASCGVLCAAILVAVVADTRSATYAVFSLSRTADALSRLGSLPLYVGICRSVNAAYQGKR